MYNVFVLFIYLDNIHIRNVKYSTKKNTKIFALSINQM